MKIQKFRQAFVLAVFCLTVFQNSSYKLSLCDLTCVCEIFFSVTRLGKINKEKKKKLARSLKPARSCTVCSLSGAENGAMAGETKLKTGQQRQQGSGSRKPHSRT